MKKILVTGGLGFIGSHTTVELIKSGYEVIIVDDLSNSQLFILENIEKVTGTKPGFYQVDMKDKDKLARVFAAERDIHAVIHFAAFKAVEESVHQPLKYYSNNLISLINLLNCMDTFGIRSIVFSSSATVYGEPRELPIKETAALQPSLSAYGSTKQIGEDILQKTAMAGLIDCICLRYFNPVGAHETGLLGELPLGKPNNLMPFITQVAAGKMEKLIVFGNDYDTVDGTCIRDYIHVVDLAKAHVKSCDRMINNKSNEAFEIYNIGTGNGYSVLEIITAFEKENRVQVNYEIGKRRKGDAKAIYADVTKAQKALQWKAEKDLKDMVVDAWHWEKRLNESDGKEV